eukprot:14913066-Alexandrium_andersonii.AAC.1
MLKDALVCPASRAVGWLARVLDLALGESEPSRDGELVAESRPAAPAASCQPGSARGMRRSGRPWRRGPGAAS